MELQPRSLAVGAAAVPRQRRGVRGDGSWLAVDRCENFSGSVGGSLLRERRVTALPCTTIASTTFIPDFSGFSTSGTDSQIAGSYQVGDVILNTVNNGETRPAYPVGWRPRQYAGGTAQYAAGGGLGNSAATWQAGFSYAYGQVILEDGYAFQASFTVDIGVSGGTCRTLASVENPGRHHRRQQHHVDERRAEHARVQSRHPGGAHPGNDLLHRGRRDSSDEPGRCRVPADQTHRLAGGVVHASDRRRGCGGVGSRHLEHDGAAATILGSSGDTGVAVPAGDAYHLLSDGTTCVHVT